MYERYSLTAQLADLTSEFRLDRIEFPDYHNRLLEPTGDIPVIRPIGGERCLGAQRWGLMPYWGKSSIHADRDTLGDKPYLLSMLAKKRCVVPCSELLMDRMAGKKKIVSERFRHPSKSVFGLAALFDIWVDSEKREFPMCTIIVSPVRAEAGRRWPVVLEGEAMDIWLDPGHTRVEPLQWLLRSISPAAFEAEAIV